MQNTVASSDRKTRMMKRRLSFNSERLMYIVVCGAFTGVYVLYRVGQKVSPY